MTWLHRDGANKETKIKQRICPTNVWKLVQSWYKNDRRCPHKGTEVRSGWILLLTDSLIHYFGRTVLLMTGRLKNVSADRNNRQISSYMSQIGENLFELCNFHVCATETTEECGRKSEWCIHVSIWKIHFLQNTSTLKIDEKERQNLSLYT